MKKSERQDVKAAHEIAKIIYNSLRTESQADYEELSKKYDGDKQIKQYLDELLQSGQSVKPNEKDNAQV